MTKTKSKAEQKKDAKDIIIRDIDVKISNLKEQLLNVKGRKTTIYTRIVGYYRAVKNWNNGKRAEFSDRKLFDPYNIEESKKIF